MLYLAEVLRKTRVIGGSRAELKLLACQRSELSWSALPNEEIVPGSDDMTYGAGALIMVELSAAKQVQRHSEAGRQLVTILQNFSRLQEKSKTQEEEIEQWKQSLTYQSQELNRREMEIEAAQEQMQQIEAEFERLEQQKQEIETAQANVQRLREEFERKSQELEGAWAHLQGETNRLEERQAAFQQMAMLDQDQANHFHALLDQLAATLPTDAVCPQSGNVTELLTQQQELLNQHWQNLEQQQAAAQQLQAEADQQTQTLQKQWTAWQQAQTALEQACTELASKQSQLQAKQEQAQSLAAQIQAQTELYQNLAQLADGCTKVDLPNLEQLPLEELQGTVKDLEKDLEKLSRFVSSQEEELVLEQQTIDELRSQIQQASEYDRLGLETELAEEQDRCQMLNQTLVGQRRNLQERQTTLKQYQAVLAKRQGFPQADQQGQSINVEPLLLKIEQSRQQYTQQLQGLEQEIRALETAIEPLQAAVSQQASDQSTRWSELQQLTQQVREQAVSVAERWSKVELYQELLQPIQDHLTSLRQQIEAALASLSRFQDASTTQHQSVAALREAVQQISNHLTPELAVS